MRQANVFVMSSEFEGLPNALIEAQGLGRLGLAAVATRWPHGPDEIVDDPETGLLVAVNDVPALAAAILRSLSDQEARRRMGTFTRRRARAKFDAATLTRVWAELILDTLAPKRRCSGE